MLQVALAKIVEERSRVICDEVCAAIGGGALIDDVPLERAAIDRSQQLVLTASVKRVDKAVQKFGDRLDVTPRGQ